MSNDGHQSETRQINSDEKQSVLSKAELLVPWDGEKIDIGKCTQSIEGSDAVVGKFIEERTGVHKVHIQEAARNKRVGMILAAALILAAFLILTFAPKGRERMSYWLGASLIIFSAGSLGYGRVWGKAAGISFGADQDKRDL